MVIEKIQWQRASFEGLRFSRTRLLGMHISLIKKMHLSNTGREKSIKGRSRWHFPDTHDKDGTTASVKSSSKHSVSLFTKEIRAQLAFALKQQKCLWSRLRATFYCFFYLNHYHRWAAIIIIFSLYTKGLMQPNCGLFQQTLSWIFMDTAELIVFTSVTVSVMDLCW